jgi:hypothetical protein
VARKRTVQLQSDPKSSGGWVLAYSDGSTELISASVGDKALHDRLDALGWRRKQRVDTHLWLLDGAHLPVP